MKWIMAIMMVITANLAFAHKERLATPNLPEWKEECGSCHLAYPPSFLAAKDWQRIMGDLGNHFGDNATLDQKTNQTILDFLKRHAGSAPKHSASSLRISDTPWFRHEHDEVPSRAWKNPEIKSRANCAACHIYAEQGDWSERGVRLPSGIRMEDDDDDD